jgi:ferrochelatase
MSERVAILLFNLGGPDTLDAVEPFLINLFSDREIIELPLGAWFQPVFARLIAKKRGPSVRDNYRRIGGGSPQLRLTRAQGEALEHRLNDASPGKFKYYIAMRYWQPSTEQALAAIEADGIRRIVTLTLYPHYSCATTGSSVSELQRVLQSPRWKNKFEISSIDEYPDEPHYLDALTDTVRHGLAGFAPEVRDRVVLLFSAHGLPQKFIERGDPYVTHTLKTRDGILERLKVKNRNVLGFQSRTGPVKWIGPGTEDKIKELAAEGVKEMLVVPLSFVTDHIETLYEVDMLFGDEARAAGITDYRRTEALNTHPLFIEGLASLVERHLALEPCPA